MGPAKLAKRLYHALLDLRLSQFRLAFSQCPFCGPTVILRLNAEPAGVRCVRCAASIVHLSIGAVLRDCGLDLSRMAVCELSSNGPFVDFLRRRARDVSLSEYSDSVPPGTSVNGVRCEDVQRLTYEDGSFDLVTHTEVLEHVPDDEAAFLELRRVMKINGTMLFTVPLSASSATVQRAAGVGEKMVHFLEPVYHTDPWQRGIGILAYRDYGLDIVSKLESAGFAGVEIVQPESGVPWIKLHKVIVARRFSGQQSQ